MNYVTVGLVKADSLVSSRPKTCWLTVTEELFDSKFTFERHIHSISCLGAQKTGLLGKSFRIFGDHDVLLRCFISLILPCLYYYSLFGPLHLCS